VELLVAMGLIILLAALAVGISQSGMLGSQKVISAADRVSQWLLIAKQRAARDQAPRGVRFFSTPLAPPQATFFTEAQYIESPEPWIPNPAQEQNFGGPRILFSYEYQLPPATMMNPNPVATVTIRRIYFVSGFVSGTTWNVGTAVADINELNQRVTPGDSLVLPELGKSFVVRSIREVNTANGNLLSHANGSGSEVAIPATAIRELVLDSYPDLSAAGTVQPMGPGPIIHQATMTTYKYGFQAVPRPLLGEPALQMTFGTIIDYRNPRTDGPFAAPGFTLNGYRDWRTPTSGTPNTAPYNPTTSLGIFPATDPANAAGQTFDLLFAPSGQILNNSTNLVVLWIRDSSKVSHPRLDATGNSVDGQAEYNLAGEQALVVLNVKSGLISTQPVFPPPAAPTVNHDPYQFARDGLNSGL
jgi:type II secretory pathway pseudopilin PulG